MKLAVNPLRGPSAALEHFWNTRDVPGRGGRPSPTVGTAGMLAAWPKAILEPSRLEETPRSRCGSGGCARPQVLRKKNSPRGPGCRPRRSACSSAARGVVPIPTPSALSPMLWTSTPGSAPGSSGRYPGETVAPRPQRGRFRARPADVPHPAVGAGARSRGARRPARAG
jgi:hypothetical protein